jgi:hypothetical protein
MEHLLIFIIQILGIGFNVWGKVKELDKLYPDDTLEDVFKLFWKTDRITVFISLWIMAAYGLFYFVTLNYAPPSVTDFEYLDLSFFGGALVIGYGGQAIVYKALGKAVDIANKKIDDQK